MKRLLKLYLDTTIPNFLFAEDAKEKQRITQILFQPNIWIQYEFYISVVVIREIKRATAQKQKQLMENLVDVEILELTEEADLLALAYLKAEALPKSSFEDAQHVAIASVHNLDAVVSWNFKHLVNLRRVKFLNLVNEEMGYKHIEIVSPQEVISL